MGQKKRPGAQEHDLHHNTQNGTGPNAKKTRPHTGPGQAASQARHISSGDVPDTRQNGAGRAVGGNKAH